MKPSVAAAVFMERERAPNCWEDWRHRVADVVVQQDAFGQAARVLRQDENLRLTLYPAFALELFRDEAEGYYLNLSSGNPVWFVLWRIDDEDPSQASPVSISLSYNEAGRWLDAQEKVDNVPLSADVREWLQAYVDANYQPEVKKRRRPQSFLPPDQRGTHD